MKRLLLTTVTYLLFVGSMYSQVQRCGTTDYYEQRKKADPTLEKRMNVQEQQVQQWIAKHPNGLKAAPVAQPTFPALPGFKPTGDEAKDRAAYAEKKALYLSQHPAKKVVTVTYDAEKIKALRAQKMKANSILISK
ncbi:MAG: hypothetical protein ABI723_18040 [Bacteroidia bacterium]